MTGDMLDQTRPGGHVHDAGPGSRPSSRGVFVSSPWAIPAIGWKQVVTRTWNEANTDNIGLISAGVSFYCFLAIVPLLGAIVMSYGLIADVGTVVANIHALATVMPAEAAELIGKQLFNAVTTFADKKGLGLLIALAISLYGGMNAAGATRGADWLVALLGHTGADVVRRISGVLLSGLAIQFAFDGLERAPFLHWIVRTRLSHRFGIPGGGALFGCRPCVRR